MQKFLRISEVAREVGLHAETIRRLEKRGLISSRRDLNGWRRFEPSVVDQLKSLYASAEQTQAESADEQRIRDTLKSAREDSLR